MSSKEEGVEPWNFSWVINGLLSGSAWPRSSSEIQWLRNRGVKAIISLSEERQPPPSAREDMDCRVIPVIEFEPPTMEQMVEFVRLCDEFICVNKPVCVHCRMGLGRTGVMLACYLVHGYQQTAADAIQNIRLMRPYSIETISQEEAVKDFYEYVKSTEKS